MLALAGGKPVPRSKLAGVLWADQSEEHARNSLRQAFFAIKRAFKVHGASPFVIDNTHGWVQKGAIVSDAEKVIEAAETGEMAFQPDLYDGEFLEGLNFKEEALDTWLRIERDRHRDMLIDCLTSIAATMERLENTEQALLAARCLLRHDPYHEPSHRLILRCHIERGERARALRYCDTLEALLEDGLGVSLDDETRSLVAQVRGQASQKPRETRPKSKLRVAVLPMVNLSRDKELDAAADTLTRKAISELGLFSPLSVVAATTMFALRSRDLTVEEIGRRASADYLLELSFQKWDRSGWVLAQLASVQSGAHVWSRRYANDALDTPEGQDRLVRTIVGSFYQILMKHAAGDADAEPEETAGGEQLYLQTFYHVERPTKAGLILARRLCNRLLSADPRHVLVRESLAWVNFHCAFNCWIDDPQEAIVQARDIVGTGLRLDDREPYLLSSYGLAQAYLGETATALDFLQRAVELNPNDAEFHTWLGIGLTWAGDLGAAHAAFDMADQVSPEYHPVFLFRADAFIASGRHDVAIASLTRFLTVLPEYHWARLLRAAALEASGETRKARRDVVTVRQAVPAFNGRYLDRLLQARSGAFREWLRTRLEGAGLPYG